MFGLTVGLLGSYLAYYLLLAREVSGSVVAAVINAVFSVTFDVLVLLGRKTESNRHVVLNSLEPLSELEKPFACPAVT